MHRSPVEMAATSLIWLFSAVVSDATAQDARGSKLPALIVDAPEPRQAISKRTRALDNGSRSRRAARAVPPVNATSRANAVPAPAPSIAVMSASEKNVSGADVNARPFSRPAEALEVVPGLIVTQHSGEGKANQYFLRGFNLDHGTDLAISVDGMPANMPTHGHGQGYADINFLIPELIQSVGIRKGPYFADLGDFASAGAVGIDYINKLPKNMAEMTFGSFGYRRALAAGSTAVGHGKLLAPVESGKYDGPGEVPDNVRKINGVLRYSQDTATDGFALTGMAYANSWNSTDQIAQRAIDLGVVGRFGSLDPTDGGTSSRFSLSGNWARSSEYGQSNISAYVVRSELQ